MIHFVMAQHTGIVLADRGPTQWNHRCNNERCINPDHVYEGTQSENMRDRYRCADC